MRNKKLYPILTIFSLVVFFSIALLYMGCKGETPESRADKEMARQIAEERLAEKEEERLAKAAEEKQVEGKTTAEDAAVTEEDTATEDKPFPNEPITYSGILHNENGTEVTLIVNFKTTDVSGLISLDSVGDYIDATINGKIDIDTLKVTSNYYGIWKLKETDEEFPFDGAINGKITEDLSTFKGIIHPDFSEVGVEFTATKK